jgi:hypothetical protein
VGLAKEKIDEKKLRSWKLLAELPKLGVSFVIRIRNKPRMELIRMYQMGHARLDEVVALLGLGKNARRDCPGRLRPKPRPDLVVPKWRMPRLRLLQQTSV